MKYFLSKSKKVVLITTMCVFSFVACTTAELDFGSEYLPDGENMEFTSTTLTGTVGYNITRDSIPTSALGVAYLGSIVTPLFGAVDASFISTYVPGSFINTDSMWGDYPAIDSVFLNFATSSIMGDTLYSDWTVTVRELSENLPFDKYQAAEDTLYYYSNFNPEPYISDDILAQFEVKRAEYTKRIELPISFAERFLDTNGMVFIYDSLFIEKFKGLHFETNAVDSRGAMRKMDLTSTYIQVYYNNQNPNVKDTTTVNFYFDYESTNRNQLIPMLNLRYDLADPIVGIDYTTVNDTIVPQEKIYIQALGGVMGQIEISKDEIQQIKDNAVAQGYSNVAINNATIKFKMNVASITNLDCAFDRLGIMYDVNEAYCISDYYPYDEGDSSETTADFGGYLNRANNEYSMDITGFIQELINGSEDYSVQLMPAYGREYEYNSMLQTEGVVLDGGGINGSFDIQVTYTLLK
ncbi:MAG: DUF4270 family protein [Rikenellaceae bacterium]